MQIRKAKSLGGGFEGEPKDVWNCQDYTDRTKPVVFCGLYDLRDYVALWRHKNKAYIFWCGGDLYNLKEGFVLNNGKLKWVSKMPWAKRFLVKLIKKAENWVENGWEYEVLKNLGVGSTICPSFLGDISKYEISYQPGKDVYVSCGKGKQIQYGFDIVERIAFWLPNVNFHLYGDTWRTKRPNIYAHGRVPIKQMNQEIKKMQCGLRLNEYDGFSEITAKSILWGQYPISRIAYPLIPSYKTEEELVRLIKDISLRVEPNIKVRDYYLKTINNFPFNVLMRVLFGGVFDLLHLGHIRQIKRAKEYGYLIVNVSSDKQARQKGKDRPIIPQYERVEMVRALRDVDEVICMDTEKLDLISLLNLTSPDILVTNEGNNDYDDVCEKRNIKVVKLPRVLCESGGTTGIINKIRR